MAETIVITDYAFPTLDHERAMAEHLAVELAAHQSRTEDDVAAVTRDATIAFVNFAPVTRRVLKGLAPAATVIRYSERSIDDLQRLAAEEAARALVGDPCTPR